MKKVIVVMLAIGMLLGLAGCGANNDENNAAIQAKVDETESLVLEMTTWYADNGYLDGDAAEQMQPMVDSLNAELEELKTTHQQILDEGGYDDEAAAEMTKVLDEAIAAYKTLIEQQETELGSNVATLTAKYNELFDLVSEATASAEANGWVEDSVFIDEQNAAAEYLNIVSEDLQAPETIDEAYSEQLSTSLDEMIAAWQEYLLMVSEPYVAE